MKEVSDGVCAGSSTSTNNVKLWQAGCCVVDLQCGVRGLKCVAFLPVGNSKLMGRSAV
jgi:hypothetical protein